ncbi:MAG: rhodanese-like domain-containing protein [Acidimicrobiia bacterium]|nr:MAG: rhodanese-like domain-containing protein [Acidimicrobiia bacterium]
MERMTIHEQLAKSRKRIDRMQPRDALEAQADGAWILDTRDEADRLRDGVIPGSLHVPLSVLPWRVDPTAERTDERINDLNGHLVLMCNHGYSSSIAAAMLKDLGFTRVADIAGGFESWAAEGLPVEFLA